MKIISVTLLIAFSVFFFNLQVFGHDACQSQRSALSQAESELSTAKAKTTTAIGIAAALAAAIELDRTDPNGRQRPMTNQEKVAIAAAGAAVIWAQDAENDARKKVNSKQTDVNNCVKLDSRDCDNDGYSDDCSRLHTQSVSSCECNCDSGAYGCECGSCSSYINNN